MGGFEIGVSPTRLLGTRLGESDDGFGFTFEKFPSVFEQDASSGKVTPECPIGKH
jgi:hypothetical protein